MRWTMALLVSFISLSAASAAPQRPEFFSSDAVLRWISGYRVKPDPAYVPRAVQALSKLGAFKETETAGVYVGFIAGIIGSNPAKADEMIAAMLPLQESDQWAIVRAIAYSGLPDWKGLMTRFITRLPAREAMIDRFLLGELPTLAQVSYSEEPSTLDKIKHLFKDKKPAKRGESLEVSGEVLDTFWGYYFATGSFAPVSRIVAMLPWSKAGGNADRITVGSMAKFTLASNASRDGKLLAMLKDAAQHQPKEIKPVLDEVVEAAETMEVARLRKDALATIEEFKTKGSTSSRTTSFWGTAGQTALAAGCVVASVTGHVELGLPCVVGGALSQAALKMMAVQ